MKQLSINIEKEYLDILFIYIDLDEQHFANKFIVQLIFFLSIPRTFFFFKIFLFWFVG